MNPWPNERVFLCQGISSPWRRKKTLGFHGNPKHWRSAKRGETTDEESFAELEGALGDLQDVVADAVLVGRVLDVDVGLGDALDVDVALLVHAHLGALADVPLHLLRLGVAHRVVEPVQPDPARPKRRLHQTDIVSSWGFSLHLYSRLRSNR